MNNSTLPNIKIRPENTGDFDEIYNLVKVAFQTAKVSDGDEQDYVIKLRNSGNYIPELALVAEINGKLIGHIMLTKLYIENLERKYDTLLVAPLSVVLEYRNMKIGSLLMEKALEAARNMGYQSAFLLGDPGYYSRFGFKQALDFGIQNKNNFPPEYVLACELIPNSLKGISGEINFL